MSDFAFRSLPFSKKLRSFKRAKPLPADPERFFRPTQRIAALSSVVLGSVLLIAGVLWTGLPEFLSGAIVAAGAALVVGAILYALFVLPIAASRQVYQYTLDHLPVGFYAADDDGTFNYVNRTFAQMLGYDLPLLLSGAVKLDDILRDEKGKPVDLTRLQTTMEPLAPSRRYLTLPDGERVPVEVALSELGEGRGEQFTHTVVCDLQHEERWRETMEAESERFHRLFTNAPIAMAVTDENGAIVEANAAFGLLGGIATDKIAGKPVNDFIGAADVEAVDEAMAGARAGRAAKVPIDIALKGEEERHVQMLASPVELSRGEAGALLFMIDTTEQRKLEHQFSQSQRLHAVAQLAGGIAHDFNNLLTAISGFADLLLQRHGTSDDPSRSEIVQIKQSAERASGLVAQLLAFSRQQTLKPEIINLGALVGGLEELIARVVGDQVRLKTDIAADLNTIKADRGQLEQVLINLCANARDAMPSGGTITVRARNIDAETAARLDYSQLPPAGYVAIEVTDSGSGIPDEILNKVFEPFFTTKQVGEGTGLGLSMVYGIVKQSDGYIYAENHPNGGAVFTIFLPVAQSAVPAQPADAGDNIVPMPGRAEKPTILLVEDEEVVRHFAARAMREKGYNILEASDGVEALEVLDSHRQKIDLMITDIVMPNMDGASLGKKVMERGKGMKVIYMSGYAQETYRQKIDLTKVNFLEKPFTLKDLTETVEEVLSA